MKKNLLNLVLILSVTASGCSLFSVYRIDIPQGTPLTHAQAAKVTVGMNTEQVKYILGSPAVVDGLSPRQWDYMYDFTPGTYGKQDKIPATHKTQKLSVFFGNNGLVEKITGLEGIPEKQHGIPSGKNKRLYSK